jgi:hypothetical protein
MTQKCDTFSSKTTFVWVQLQVYFSELGKYNFQVLKMLFPIFVVYIEIKKQIFSGTCLPTP